MLKEGKAAGLESRKVADEKLWGYPAVTLN